MRAALRNGFDGDDALAEVPPTRLANWPTGPSPKTASVPPSGTSAYFTPCQAVGRMSREEEVALVGQLLAHLDWPVVGERHAQVLRLAAGD